MTEAKVPGSKVKGPEPDGREFVWIRPRGFNQVMNGDGRLHEGRDDGE